MSFKVVIPARFASARLPGKPLLNLCGMPMYWHVVQQVLNAGFDINDIFLATDDQRIFDSAVKFSVPVLMTRADHDRLNEVASIYSWPDETLVFNVQGDEPMIPSLLIKQLKSFSESVSKFDLYRNYSFI
ncbi:cytidylyltransferase domain-containing protein [Vibrio cholerae]|uniref:cytidylyltransferase domain-containing protein n=1 Tax=Vibrio cholerae TaxID=666 RepID=UPI0001D5AAC6|nr:3-deoxy-manno-octulosonate cytidylyltransferase [Vibrio cholerae RC385]